MSHNGKDDRIKNIYQQLKLPAPMQRIKIDIGMRVLISTGVDITVCKKCNIGKIDTTRFTDLVERRIKISL